MTTRMDPMEKVGIWDTAFDAIRRSIVSDKHRETLAKMEEMKGIEELASYMRLAHEVMASDRTAAIVAAMLVQSGVSRPVMVEE